MKSKAVLLMLAGIMGLSLVGCGAGGGTPKGSVEQNGININPVSEVKPEGSMSIGDVMPFFDGETINVYHLQNKTGSNSMWYHPIACVSTTDFVHYEERGIALDFEEYYDSYDAALGTGSFIRDEETGTVHCFYTGHNAELTPMEVVRHAVSNDNQKTWTKDESFILKNGNNDFRDPYLYYDEEEKKYCMLVTTRSGGTGVIDRYTSSDLSAYPDEWVRDRDSFFVNDSGTYNMECPSYFEYNGFYYLMFSEQGENRVTHYRYKKNAKDRWIKPANDAIDSEGFYAGRPVEANGKLYCFAWCAKTTTGDDYGEFDWAGNLVAHRLKQKPNGELVPVMIPNIKNALSTRVDYNLTSGGTLGELDFSGEKFEAKTAEPLGGNVTRMSFRVEFTDAAGDCGITFGLSGSGDNRLGNAVIAFDAERGELRYYNDVYSVVRYRDPLVSLPFKFETGKKYNVDLVIDGQILSVYLADELAMTVRIYSMANKNFAFYSNGAAVKFGEIGIYE